MAKKIAKLPAGDYKLSFRAWHETDAALKRIVASSIGDKRLLFGGARTHQGVLMNALVLWFDRLPEDERGDALAIGMQIVNGLANEGEGGDPLPRVQVHSQQEPKASAAKPKGRSGGNRGA